jgi:protein-disulfide isomerase
MCLLGSVVESFIRMFDRMKRLLVLFMLAAGCRPSGSQGTPANGETTAARGAQSTDSARAEAVLERADRARIQGDSAAPVWLVELSDFQCPFCKQWHDETYPVLVREYVVPGVVRLAYVNLPLQMHAQAFHAAEAAMCGAAQNRFWQMHDGLFATQKQWGELSDTAAAVVFDSLAVSTGVNPAEWRDCMRSGVMRRLVNADRSRGASAGIRSTPMFFVGDEPIQGAAPIETFRAAIERARAKAAAGRAPR